MHVHSAEEAKKRFDSLPPEIKNILYSPEMSFAIQQVGQKNKLHIDQIDFLNTEAAQVLLGFVDMKDFTEELTESLNIDQQKAGIIAKDIEEMLFSKIREAMKKTYEANKVPAPIAAAPTPTPPVSKLPPLSDRSTPPAIPTPLGGNASTGEAPATSAIYVSPTVPAIPPVPPIPPKSAASAPNMHPAELMMSEKTVQVSPPQAVMPQKNPINLPIGAKPTPPPAGNYKKDPYREPVE